MKTTQAARKRYRHFCYLALSPHLSVPVMQIWGRGVASQQLSSQDATVPLTWASQEPWLFVSQPHAPKDSVQSALDSHESHPMAFHA